MSGLILSRRDIFDPSHTFVGHGTNVVGVMAAGIAPLFARRYPGLLGAYAEHCRTWTALGRRLTGSAFVYGAPDGTKVANIYSQDTPGRHARIEWLGAGVHDALWRTPGTDPLHLPWIGAGIGGLSRLDVAIELSHEAHSSGRAIIVHELAEEPTLEPAVLELFDHVER